MKAITVYSKSLVAIAMTLFCVQGLAQVKDQITGISNALLSLENKCDVMNNDIVKIDCLFSSAFNVEPNLERVAASEGKEDCRDD